MSAAFFLVINRWIIALYLAATGRDDVRSQPSKPPRGRFLAMLAILLFHGGTWAAVVIVSVTIFVLLKPHEDWWHWFFAAFYVTPMAVYTLGALLLYRAKRRRPVA